MKRQAMPINEMLPFLDRMIEAMGEAVLVIDASGQVLAANQATCDLLDLPDTAAALRPISEYHQLIKGWHVGGEVFPPTSCCASRRARPSPASWRPSPPRQGWST